MWDINVSSCLCATSQMGAKTKNVMRMREQLFERGEERRHAPASWSWVLLLECSKASPGARTLKAAGTLLSLLPCAVCLTYISKSFQQGALGASQVVPRGPSLEKSKSRLRRATSIHYKGGDSDDHDGSPTTTRLLVVVGGEGGGQGGGEGGAAVCGGRLCLCKASKRPAPLPCCFAFKHARSSLSLPSRHSYTHNTRTYTHFTQGCTENAASMGMEPWPTR